MLQMLSVDNSIPRDSDSEDIWK